MGLKDSKKHDIAPLIIFLSTLQVMYLYIFDPFVVDVGISECAHMAGLVW